MRIASSSSFQKFCFVEKYCVFHLSNYFNIKIAQLQKKAIVNQVITNEAQNKIFLKTTVCILREIILFILKKDKYNMFFCLFFRETFFQIVKEQCSNHFKANIDKILGHLSKSGSVVDDNVRSLFFGDYMASEGGKAYDEVTDLKELTSAMEK